MMGKRIGNFVHTQAWNDFVYTDIQQKNKQLKEDKARLQQENKSLSQENKNLSKEIEELRVQNGNFAQLQGENNLLKNQSSGMQQTIAFLQKQLAIQRLQVDKLTKEGQRKQNDIDALQNSVQQLTLMNQKPMDHGGAPNYNMHSPLSQNNELLAKIHEPQDARKQQDAATQTSFESEKEDEKEDKKEDKKDQPQTQHYRMNMEGVAIFEETRTDEYYKDKMKEQKKKKKKNKNKKNKGKTNQQNQQEKCGNNADQWSDDEYSLKFIYGGNKAQYGSGGYRAFDKSYK